ncbi:MAG: beta-ketoacyl synthase N-terminal-like domain-containing protein, partial [Actinomycetes bacterium]
MTDSFVLSSLRTPFGKFGKGYSSVRPDDLAAGVIAALVERHLPDASLIDEAIFGNANGAGEENRNVARMSLLLAGLPTSIPGSTVNRLCGSGLDAAISAARMIETGDAELVIAGGVESMTRAPWVLMKPDKAFPAQNATLENTALGWRLVNPDMPQEWSVSLGLANEAVATKYKVSRVEQDEFAMRSHQLAAAAWDGGFYDLITAPVAGTDIVRDESIRSTTSMSDLAGLKPAFTPDGSITAGNASPLS